MRRIKLFSPAKILEIAGYEPYREGQMIRRFNKWGSRLHAKIEGNWVELHFDKNHKYKGIEYHSANPKPIVNWEVKRLRKIDHYFPNLDEWRLERINKAETIRKRINTKAL